MVSASHDTGKNYLLVTLITTASFLWDIGKQNSPRCDTAERGVPSGVIMFAPSILFITSFKQVGSPTPFLVITKSYLVR